MKTLLVLIAAVFCLVSVEEASAAPKILTKQRTSKLSTDVNFEDRVVGGKYQYSTEAVTTVENDKGIDDLIGVRKNFKDRVIRSESLR